MSNTNAYNIGLGQSMALHQSCTLDSWPFALRFLLPEKSVQKKYKNLCCQCIWCLHHRGSLVIVIYLALNALGRIMFSQQSVLLNSIWYAVDLLKKAYSLA